MGVFTHTKKGLVLKSYGASSILADPSAEGARVPQVQLAITELAKKLKATNKKAAYALSGQAVFVKFVKLPPLDAEDIGEIVQFEAQQNVPFPLDEVVWDWEKLDTGGIETEVVLVAIKADSLNDLNAVVQETGLGTQLVDSAPMALYNALRFNYPDLSESTLLLDVGAKTTNLIYADGKKFFARSVSIGGANITSAVAKEYDVSFAEAENSKLTSGLVTLGGGHTRQLDEASATLGSVIRNSLTRLTAEIQRTATLSRSQHGINPPQKVLLAGGTANLICFKEFLEEKLQLPVELFNPLRRISVGKSVDLDALAPEVHQLGEIVGLGLRGADLAEVDIDLVPDAVQAQRDITKKKPILMAASGLLLAGLATWTGFQMKSSSDAQSYIEELEGELSELQRPAKRIETLLKKEDAAFGLISSYHDAEKGRLSVIDTWNQLSGSFTSENVWVTDYELRTNFEFDGDIDSDAVTVEDFAGVEYGRKVLKDGVKMADSVLIKGLHMNAKSELIKILNRMREAEETPLAFEWNQKEIPNDQIMIKSESPDPSKGEYAGRFELLIPLKEAVSIR